MKIKHKLKRFWLFLVLPPALAITISAGDQYFEVSKQIDIFITLYKEIDAQYVDEVNHAKLMRTAIDAMLEELDPYTVFFSESEVEDYKFQQTGKYGGIGAQVGRRDGKFIILEVYEGYAADKGGVLAGDIILSVDGKDVSGKTVDDLSPFLKGEPNTQLTIEVERRNADKPLALQLTRDEVKVDNITHAEMLDDGIGYVKFSNFRQEAANEVKEKLKAYQDEGMKYFILDLRGNPGGLLSEAVALVDLFVDRNKLVVSTKGKSPYHTTSYTTQRSAYADELPVVILIDESSASASEIVSGTLQDYDRAVVVGNTTFGKGLVQNIRPLSYNTQLKVTTSKYYIPSGRCIQRLDYANKDDEGNAVEMPDSLKRMFTTENGRKVYDGAGVDPDVFVKDAVESALIQALKNQYMIFDFATDFHASNPSIEAPKSFAITDELFASFKSFLNAADFTFETRTEVALNKLEKQAEKGGYNKALEAEIAKMRQILAREKAEAIDEQKDHIKELLRLEIVGRYYYRAGKAKAALVQDPDLDQAKEILLNSTRYQKILSPQ